MNEPRAGATAVTLRDGRVLVVGGNDLADHRSAELYDPATATWTRAASSNAAHDAARAVVLGDGRVMFVGGRVWARQDGDAEIYDPVVDRWTVTAATHNLAGAGQAVAGLHDGRVLVVGGDSSPAAEVYDPARNAWSVVAPTHELRSDAGAVTLPDGRVLVAGGWARSDGPALGATARRTAEIFDPATGLWSRTGSLSKPRWQGASLVMLAGGQPAYVGGTWATIVGTSLGIWVIESTADIYDAASGTWRETPAMTYARAHHIAAPLPDGSLLVAGGMGTTTAVGPLAERLAPRPTPPAPPASPSAPVVRPAAPAAPRRGTLTFARLPKRLKPTRAGMIVVRLRCSGAPCSDRLVLRGRWKLLAQRDLSVAAGQTISVRLKLSATARRALRHRTTRATLGLLRQGTKVSATVRG